jgi:hypothetical protein
MVFGCLGCGGGRSGGAIAPDSSPTPSSLGGPGKDGLANGQPLAERRQPVDAAPIGPGLFSSGEPSVRPSSHVPGPRKQQRQSQMEGPEALSATLEAARQRRMSSALEASTSAPAPPSKGSGWGLSGWFKGGGSPKEPKQAEPSSWQAPRPPRDPNVNTAEK